MKSTLAIFIGLAICFLRRAEGALCACATENVHVRSTPSADGAILTQLNAHECLPHNGQKQVGGSYTWLEVDWKGHHGWAASNYLTVKDCGSTGTGIPAATSAPSGTGTGTGTSHGGPNFPGCPHIVTRAEWGARAATSHIPNMSALPIYVFVHHGASPECFTKETCTQKVRSYQAYHMDGRGYSDMGYNFVVGEDGNAYEARGWDEVGAHTLNYNHVGIAICVIGDFSNKLPNAAALQAVQALIQCGLNNHKISPHYTLKGHRDVGITACPGQTLYDHIHSWPHYVAGHDLFQG